MLTRRSFLAGLITAPAIVHTGNIMRVRPVETFHYMLNGEVGRYNGLLFIDQLVDHDTLTVDGIHKITRDLARFQMANGDYICHIPPTTAMLFCGI